MNDIQAIIDRQIGLNNRFNYDNILRRLVVKNEDSFNGFDNNAAGASLDQDSPIFACRFSEAPGYEHILALANEDGKIALQNTQNLNEPNNLNGYQCHNNAVFDLAWMPQHMSFVTVSGDHTACLWDIQESGPKRVLVFSGHTKSVKTAVFRPNEPHVFATGARDGHILVWDIRGNHQPAIVLKPDNSLMNCHSSFTPKTPSSHSKRPRAENIRATSITGLVFQHDTALISCGECDGNIKVWDLRKNYNIYKREPLPKHSIPYCGSSTKNGYTNLIIDDARMRLYASCMDNVIYSYNISTYNSLPEQRYIGHENSTFYIKSSLSPDCKYLVSGSSDKNAYIWNVKYSQPLVKLVGHWAEVTCAAWSQKGDTSIVTCSDDARHKIWRIGREFLNDYDLLELRGRAEIVPQAEVGSLPQWGALENTPKSVKRRQSTPTSSRSKRPRLADGNKKTKRCLTDMMNAYKDSDEPAKRIKMDLPSVPEGDENNPKGIDGHTSPKRIPDDWSYISPKASTSFMTPTKNYEKPNCKKITPRKSPIQVELSPHSPKVRIISFNTPTKDLPNFVLNGEAPHLRLMSPVKKKQETTNWLTLIARERQGKGEAVAMATPLSPKENIPTRRSSTTDKTPKSQKHRTLFKYFHVKEK